MTAALVALAMAVGVAGTVVPVLPGLLLVWGAALVYGLVEGFGATGVAAMAFTTGLLVAGSVAGFVLPKRAAAGAGAATASVWLGGVVGIVGFFVVPVIGFPLGGVVGVLAGELWRSRDAAVAWRSTVATLKGFGWAALAQLLAALAMVAVWVVWLVT